MRISNERLMTILFFSLRFTAFAVLLNIGVIVLNLILLQSLIAIQVSNLLGIFGIEAMVQGPIIFFDGFNVLVSKDSTGWKSAVFLSALIVSTSSSEYSRIWGLLMFIPAIFIVNIIRVAVTSYSAFYGIEAFNLFHDILWQAGMMFAVIGLWLVWLKFVRKTHS